MIKNIGSAFLRKCGHTLTVVAAVGMCAGVFWRWGVSETTIFVVPWLLAGILVGRSFIKEAIDRIREPASSASAPAAGQIASLPARQRMVSKAAK